MVSFAPAEDLEATMPLKTINWDGIDEERTWREAEQYVLDCYQNLLHEGWQVDPETGLLYRNDHPGLWWFNTVTNQMEQRDR